MTSLPNKSFVLVSSTGSDRSCSEDSDIEVIEGFPTTHDNSDGERHAEHTSSDVNESTSTELPTVSESATNVVAQLVDDNPEHSSLNVNEDNVDEEHHVERQEERVAGPAISEHSLAESDNENAASPIVQLLPEALPPEPSRLQIICTRQVVESLPESDAPLADMQDAGAYEEDSGETPLLMETSRGVATTDVNPGPTGILPSVALTSGMNLRCRSISYPGRCEDSSNSHVAPGSSRRKLTVYRHHEHNTLPDWFAQNEFLTKAALLAFIFAFALGLGHYLGSQSFSSKLANHHGESLIRIDDQLSRCRSRQDDLEAMLNDLKANMVPKQFVDKWENLYQEGEHERDSLKVSMDFYKSRHDKVKEELESCQANMLDTSKSDKTTPETDSKVSASMLGKMKARIAALENQKQSLEGEVETLRKTVDSHAGKNATVNSTASIPLAAIKNLLLEEMQRQRFVVLHEVREFLSRHQPPSMGDGTDSRQETTGKDHDDHKSDRKPPRRPYRKWHWEPTGDNVNEDDEDDDHESEEDAGNSKTNEEMGGPACQNFDALLNKGKRSFRRMKRTLTDNADKWAGWMKNRMKWMMSHV